MVFVSIHFQWPIILLSSGTFGAFPGLKLQGREADYSHPSSAKVKNYLSYTCTPLYILRAWYLIKHGDKMTSKCSLLITAVDMF
jgi:hypothetical protein